MISAKIRPMLCRAGISVVNSWRLSIQNSIMDAKSFFAAPEDILYSVRGDFVGKISLIVIPSRRLVSGVVEGVGSRKELLGERAGRREGGWQ